MLNLFALLIGFGIAGGIGWLLVRNCEGEHTVLGHGERIAWGLILGPTLLVLMTTVLHALHIVKLNLAGFLIPALVLAALFCFLLLRQVPLPRWWAAAAHPEPALRHQAPKAVWIVLIILLLWTGTKLAAGAYDLALTPTYWDDSFNNWNMRGKVFYLEEKLLLEIPLGNQAVASAQGISSYPPALPLIKTWLSTLRAAWDEPLINGMHTVYSLALLVALFYGVRRFSNAFWGFVGAYIVTSFPLFLIQASNPYAEVFLASHVLLVAIALLNFAHAKHAHEQRGWLLLFGASLGLLLFTKNEATVLYAPVLVLMLLCVLVSHQRNGHILIKNFVRPLGLALGIVVLLALPWIVFKWMNGLSFGNAKSVTHLNLAFNPQVPSSLWYHFFKESNWHFLPVAFIVIVLGFWRKALRLPYATLTVFLVVVTTAQMLIFVFVQELGTEAVMQTGVSRGIVHLAPLATMLMVLLAKDVFKKDRVEG